MLELSVTWLEATLCLCEDEVELRLQSLGEMYMESKMTYLTRLFDESRIEEDNHFASLLQRTDLSKTQLCLE